MLLAPIDWSMEVLGLIPARKVLQCAWSGSETLWYVTTDRLVGEPQRDRELGTRVWPQMLVRVRLCLMLERSSEGVHRWWQVALDPSTHLLLFITASTEGLRSYWFWFRLRTAEEI